MHTKTTHSGFILVTTIWFLAIALLAASAFALWTNRSIAMVSEQSNETQAIINGHSTTATLLYMLATQRMNAGGLITNPLVLQTSSSALSFIDGFGLSSMPIDGSELFLDGRTYKGIGNVRFSIQDEAGFINVNSSNGNLLLKLLKNYGLTNREGDALLDKLLDYTDRDDLHRLQGAEAYHYEKLGKPIPSNRALTGPHELSNVLDWDVLISKNPELVNSLGISPNSSINLNAADEGVLMALSEGIDKDSVKIILEERKIKPFVSLAEASNRTKLSLAGLFERLSIYPSQTIRISTWYNGAKVKQQMVIKNTPSSRDGRPWKNLAFVTFKLSDKEALSTVNSVEYGLLSASGVTEQKNSEF